MDVPDAFRAAGRAGGIEPERDLVGRAFGRLLVAGGRQERIELAALPVDRADHDLL